eukprot:13568324-Alexandrium_andersonii.AAC.1
MSVVGGSIQPEGNSEDVDEEMGYLEGVLGRPFECAEERLEAVGLVRALFAAGATPGEVRAPVCKVLLPPARRRRRRGIRDSGCSLRGRSTFARAPG